VLDNVSDPQASIGDTQMDWLLADLKPLASEAPIVVFTTGRSSTGAGVGLATRTAGQGHRPAPALEDVTVFYGAHPQEHHFRTAAKCATTRDVADLLRCRAHVQPKRHRCPGPGASAAADSVPRDLRGRVPPGAHVKQDSLEGAGASPAAAAVGADGAQWMLALYSRCCFSCRQRGCAAQERVIQVTAESFKFTPGVNRSQGGRARGLELTTLDRSTASRCRIQIDEVSTRQGSRSVRIRAGQPRLTISIAPFRGSGHRRWLARSRLALTSLHSGGIGAQASCLPAALAAAVVLPQLGPAMFRLRAAGVNPSMISVMPGELQFTMRCGRPSSCLKRLLRA